MKKLLVTYCMLVFFLGSCSSFQPASLSIPTPFASSTTTPSSDPKWTSTPAPATATSPATPTVEVTLTSTPLPNIQEAKIQSIVMKDETSGWAWARDKAYYFYLLHTSDGGWSWEDVTPDRNVGMTYFLTSQTAWATFFDSSDRRTVSLSRTTDGGSSWVLMNQEMRKIEGVSLYSSVGFEDEENGWWQTVDIGAGTARIFNFRTQDGGATWELIPINVLQEMMENYYIRVDGYGEVAICNICGAFFYFDLSRVIFSPGQWTPTTLWITKDLGATWQKIELTGLPEDIDPESSPIHYPTFFNDREGILPVIISDVVTPRIFIYGTQDGGLTWKLESGQIAIDAKTYGNTDTLFITRLDGFLNSENGLSTTHDGGKTWKYTPWPEDFQSSDDYYIERQLSFVSSDTGWAFLKKVSRNSQGTLDNIFLKTTDGGITWTKIEPVINP